MIVLRNISESMKDRKIQFEVLTRCGVVLGEERFEGRVQILLVAEQPARLVQKQRQVSGQED